MVIWILFFVCVFLLKHNGEKSLWHHEYYEKLMVVSENVPSFSGEAVVYVITDVLYPLTIPESLPLSLMQRTEFFFFINTFIQKVLTAGKD